MNLHWYHYAGFAFSAVYTLLSVLWTLRAERLLRDLRKECAILKLSLAYAERDLIEVQRYLEKTPTAHMKTAPFLPKLTS